MSETKTVLQLVAESAALKPEVVCRCGHPASNHRSVMFDGASGCENCGCPRSYFEVPRLSAEKSPASEKC